MVDPCFLSLFFFFLGGGGINSCFFSCFMLCTHSRFDSVFFVTLQPTWCGLLVRPRRVHLLLSPWERTSRLSACLQKHTHKQPHTHMCGQGSFCSLACVDQCFGFPTGHLTETHWLAEIDEVQDCFKGVLQSCGCPGLLLSVLLSSYPIRTLKVFFL